MANAPACHVSIEYGLHGPAFATVSACASSNHAIAQAFHMVRSGVADAAVTGGTEACITLGAIRAWEAMRVLADDTCRPFCKQRRGLVLGEGAAMFVLETLEHAKATRRDDPCRARWRGHVGRCAATSCSRRKPARRWRCAARLRTRDLAPDSIDYINAHGTGTPANDPTESRAIRRMFGTHADALAVSSTKSMHGHALGAAGAIELVATIGALCDGVIPPTANFLDRDPECDLDYVPNIAREKPVRAALSNSFAFGGLNAVLALRRAP